MERGEGFVEEMKRLERILTEQDKIIMLPDVELVSKDYNVPMSYIYNLMGLIERKNKSRGEEKDLDYSLYIVRKYLKMKVNGKKTKEILTW